MGHRRRPGGRGQPAPAALSPGCVADHPTTTASTTPTCATPFPSDAAPASRNSLASSPTAPGARPACHRLTDVEWAVRSALPMPERALGTTARYAVIAGQ